jgi:hypothetical protein
MLFINYLQDFLGTPRALLHFESRKADGEMKSRKRHARKTRQHGARSRRRQTNRGPQTAEQYFAQSNQAQDKWNRVTHVISKMRAEGVSLTEASREFGLDPRAVVRLGKPALKKRSNGRYSAKSTDNLLRVLVLPTGDGLREVAVRDSRQATLLAKYWVAVQKYLETGDASALRKIRRKTITDSDGKRVRLIKDLAELDRQGSAGVLSFESIYAKVA